MLCPLTYAVHAKIGPDCKVELQSDEGRSRNRSQELTGGR